MAVTSEEAWTYLEEQLSRSSKAEVNFAADFRLAHSILGEVREILRCLIIVILFLSYHHDIEYFSGGLRELTI